MVSHLPPGYRILSIVIAAVVVFAVTLPILQLSARVILAT